MLSDKEIATEILTIEKNLSDLYYTAAQESRTEPIINNLKTMMIDTLSDEHDTIQLLLDKGLYKIENVDRAKVIKVKEKYEKSIN